MRELTQSRIALAPLLAHYAPMLARVLFVAIHGFEAFPLEVEVNSGWGATVVVIVAPPHDPP
jgi:hypothetical protein